MTAQNETATSVTIRPLLASDLEAVVALDRASSGTSRNGYFEKRLKAAIRQPRGHLQLGACASDGQLVGFLLARKAGGEYGRAKAAMVLESVAVDAKYISHGLGQKMLASLEDLMRERDIKNLFTQVEWYNHAMMKFIHRAKFTLAPRLILERPVHRMPLPPTDEEIEAIPPLVRHLRDSDLDAVVRIDSKITNDNRSEYFKRKFDEALHESAIAVSLVTEDDGFVVAYAMARVDFGDFGHVEATASLDTIGVNPGFASKGYARATLTQMVDNLAALHVEKLETEVAHDNLALLKFFYHFGFKPSQRLSFQKTL